MSKIARQVVAAGKWRYDPGGQGGETMRAKGPVLLVAVTAGAACGGTGGEGHPGMDTWIDDALDPGMDPGPGTEIIPPYRRTLWDPGVRGGILWANTTSPANPVQPS